MRRHSGLLACEPFQHFREQLATNVNIIRALGTHFTNEHSLAPRTSKDFCKRVNRWESSDLLNAASSIFDHKIKLVGQTTDTVKSSPYSVSSFRIVERLELWPAIFSPPSIDKPIIFIRHSRHKLSSTLMTDVEYSWPVWACTNKGITNKRKPVESFPEASHPMMGGSRDLVSRGSHHYY